MQFLTIEKSKKIFLSVYAVCTGYEQGRIYLVVNCPSTVALEPLGMGGMCPSTFGLARHEGAQKGHHLKQVAY